MDKKLRNILTECIRDIETGTRDVDGCLDRYPERAAELRPHLELWSSLDAAPRARPNFAGQQRGQQRLLAAIAGLQKGGERRMIPFPTPALAKGVAVVAGVLLLAGGAAGASAAFGGPNVAGEVFTAVGITDGTGPNENANTNAGERCQNATQGRGNANENAANAGDHPNARSGEGGATGEPNENANPRSGDRCLNADADGNGADDPNENASTNAGERCGNATQGSGNADENAANAGGHPNARSGEGGASGEPDENANPRSGGRCLNADSAGDGVDSPDEEGSSNDTDGADNAEDEVP